jgi:hypothetical protein
VVGCDGVDLAAAQPARAAVPSSPPSRLRRSMGRSALTHPSDRVTSH